MVAGDFANIKEALYELLDYHDIDTDKIKSLEQNCGSIWITMDDGELLNLMLIKSEGE